MRPGTFAPTIKSAHALLRSIPPACVQLAFTPYCLPWKVHRLGDHVCHPHAASIVIYCKSSTQSAQPLSLPTATHIPHHGRHANVDASSPIQLPVIVLLHHKHHHDDCSTHLILHYTANHTHPRKKKKKKKKKFTSIFQAPCGPIGWNVQHQLYEL